jgi:hypothetical protein
MEHKQRRVLLGLADKYRVILRLRGSARPGDAAQARAEMAALAARFPGALRELDQLPQALIVARLVAIESALTAEVPEPWMLVQGSYHGFMRAALRIRRLWPLRNGSRSQTPLAAMGYQAAEDEPPVERLGLEELAAISRPPEGRLTLWVLAQVALDHGITSDEVHGALFHGKIRVSQA